ncbi:c-type cytochrome [Candidatus Nitrosacidococcus tergens]|uniref:Cytochrome c, class I n=1 Tax=Candidatus Nitrosacidococcus tergens TaxID=553981 RepID=A0A7G1QBZ7_9GAMM|nr:cytochrome c [Candidatus Nitrosacidococcus tergens]CAB1277552.1 Cytochrome c, class I [Candidatus Nitrosacidococcus tergens]
MDKKSFPIFLLGTSMALLFSMTVQAAGDPVVGRQKADQRQCQGCHGIEGLNNAYPTYKVPKLGGQHAEYIVSALQAYKSGDRKHPSMQGSAGSLTEQDMEDIAAFFEKQ